MHNTEIRSHALIEVLVSALAYTLIAVQLAQTEGPPTLRRLQEHLSDAAVAEIMYIMSISLAPRSPFYLPKAVATHCGVDLFKQVEAYWAAVCRNSYTCSY